MTRRPYKPNPRAELTPQQKNVLWYIANGNSAARAAELMSIKTATAREHLRRAYLVLGASNGVHAVHIAYQRGIFKVDPLAARRLEPTLAEQIQHDHDDGWHHPMFHKAGFVGCSDEDCVSRLQTVVIEIEEAAA